jgi:hypothetical protein
MGVIGVYEWFRACPKNPNLQGGTSHGDTSAPFINHLCVLRISASSAFRSVVAKRIPSVLMHHAARIGNSRDIEQRLARLAEEVPLGKVDTDFAQQLQ